MRRVDLSKYDFEDTCMDELKAVAFEALLLNPGSEYGDWEQELIHNYAMEVVDCYGSDPFEACASLRDLWETCQIYRCNSNKVLVNC